MTKKELLSVLPLKKAEAEAVVDVLFGAINSELEKGEKVAIKGFGTFSVKTRSAKRGFNPKTKEAVEIPEKKVVKFKSALKLQ